MRHSNSAKFYNEVNLHASIMASPCGEEHDVTSQSSRLIPEYENLRTSGLRQSKIIQCKYKKGKVIPKVFGLIDLFASVAMSCTKYILPKIASFAAKLLHNEERSKCSPDNLSNFVNPLVSSKEAVHDTFSFKDATSQPASLKLVG